MCVFAACQTPLGMQSGAIPDNSLSASTFKDNSHKAVNARPSQSVGWCSKVIFALDRFLPTCKQIRFLHGLSRQWTPVDKC